MKLNVKINFFIIIALISFYFLLCGIRGSIQDRIDLFKNFSFHKTVYNNYQHLAIKYTYQYIINVKLEKII